MARVIKPRAWDISSAVLLSIPICIIGVMIASTVINIPFADPAVEVTVVSRLGYPVVVRSVSPPLTVLCAKIAPHTECSFRVIRTRTSKYSFDICAENGKPIQLVHATSWKTLSNGTHLVKIILNTNE